jgi:hypothetical protein
MSTPNFALRLLDPGKDADLYRQAYSWRPAPKTHVQPDRMSFADFIGPDGIAIGLFDDELCAVYFLHETAAGNFQAHFTSRRGVARETLLTAAAQVAEDFFAAGATEIHAWVTERNTALRHFLTHLGFICVERAQFCCAPTEFRATMTPDRNQRSFVKYSLKVNQDRNFRQKAKFDLEPDD